MSAFGSRILRGVAWNAVAQIGNQAINLGVTVLLTRLLPASTFGLVAMAGVITGFFLVFPGLGLGAALIQKADAQERHYTSIYWVNVAVGVGLAALVALAGPLAARFFDEPSLVWILAALSLQFPISALGAIPRVQLRRELRFDTLSRTDLLAAVCGGACGLALALAGAGVVSLVARALVTSVLSSAFVNVARPYRPGLRIDPSAVRECAGFGMHLMGWELLVYVFRNFDNMLVGRYLGAVALGLYSRAYTFMLVPLIGVTHVIAGVLFPALSQIQDDDARVRAVFVRVSGAVALVAFPASAWFVVAAEPFVRVVLGARWEPVAVLLQILCPTGLWECFGGLAATLYRAKGRTDLHLRVSVVSYLLSMVAFAVGLSWGLVGVAVGYVVASGIIAAPALHFAMKLVDLPPRQLAVHLGGVLGATAAAAGVAGLIQWWAREHVGHLAQLVIATVTLGGTYAGALLVARPAAFRDVLELLRARSRRSGAPA